MDNLNSIVLYFLACMTCANKEKRGEKRELKGIPTSPLPRLSPPLSTPATQFGLRYSACRKVVSFFRFFEASEFKRKTSENSSPVSLVRAPRPLRASVAKKKKRVKWRLFCLPNSKLILIFGKTSPSYSYGRSPPGHFVYFVQKDLGGRSLCFFTRSAIFKSK